MRKKQEERICCLDWDKVVLFANIRFFFCFVQSKYVLGNAVVLWCLSMKREYLMDAKRIRSNTNGKLHTKGVMYWHNALCVYFIYQLPITLGELWILLPPFIVHSPSKLSPLTSDYMQFMQGKHENNECVGWQQTTGFIWTRELWAFGFDFHMRYWDCLLLCDTVCYWLLDLENVMELYAILLLERTLRLSYWNLGHLTSRFLVTVGFWTQSLWFQQRYWQYFHH